MVPAPLVLVSVLLVPRSEGLDGVGELSVMAPGLELAVAQDVTTICPDVSAEASVTTFDETLYAVLGRRVDPPTETVMEDAETGVDPRVIMVFPVAAGASPWPK
jgi:hypothetical protein